MLQLFIKFMLTAWGIWKKQSKANLGSEKGIFFFFPSFSFNNSWVFFLFSAYTF